MISEENMSRWHKSIARIAGALALMIVRRRARPTVLQGMAADLRKVAEEMDNATRDTAGTARNR